MKTPILIVFCCITGYHAAKISNLVGDGGLDGKGVYNEHDLQNFDMKNISRAELSWLFIFPGTKWCGPGNRAKNYDDLGIFTEVDKCCREHDHCDDFILGGGTKYNLTNPSSLTRLPCRCDNRFLKCLKDANHIVGIKIGKIYFNLLGTKCYREDYPATCQRIKLVPRKCVKYCYDTSSEKLYQWFDTPQYKLFWE